MTRKEELLAAALEYAATNGMGDLSLRQLAGALGTSHRMLIYHFGSKDGLLVEIVRAVEEQQRGVLAALTATPDSSPAELIRGMWRQVSDPSVWSYGKLFFEMCGRALQGDPHAKPLLDNLIEPVLEPGTRWGMARGLSRREARAEARLGLAVFRGLFLDLLATGDKKGVDAAMARFVAVLEATPPD